jgi:hypothetical protein
MTTPFRLPRLLLGACALIAACGDATARAASSNAQFDTLPGGIVLVRNSGPTAWAGTSGPRFVHERDLMPPEGSPGALVNPRAVVAASDGSIYVLDRNPAVIKAFDALGDFQRTIGGEGEGPGEFRSGMFGIARDTLFLQEPGTQRLHTFTTSGSLIGAASTHCCLSTPRLPVFHDGTIGIIGPLAAAGVTSGRYAFFATELDGDIQDTIVSLPEATPEPTAWSIRQQNGNSTLSLSATVPLQPVMLMAWLPDRRRVVGRTDETTISLIGPRGDTLRRFTLPPRPVAVTAQQRDSLFEAAMASVQPQWREAMRAAADKSMIPSTWPEWSAIAVDAEARIWIARPGTAGAVSSLDVFSPDGVLLGTIAPPTPGALTGFWTRTRLYLRDETASGLPRIRIFRLEGSDRGGSGS